MTDPSYSPALLSPDPDAYSGARRWYVALSGGMDSTVLLHLLWQHCRNSAGVPELAAVHVNHQLQQYGDRENNP